MNAETGIQAAHANLNAALVAAQADMPAPRKDREVTVKMTTGGSYKFSYATMAGMMESDRPILAKHGLGFVQFVKDGAMVTRIIHESGETLDCPLPMPNLPNKPQEAGSVITYFKRYSYSAAFGRVADEEDDANIAEGNGYEPRDRAPAHRADPAPPKLATDEQRDTIQTVASAANKPVKDICAAYAKSTGREIASLKDLTAAEANAVIARLQKLTEAVNA